MKYKIEIKEIVSKYNVYTIEVENEEEGEEIAEALEQYVEDASHPDDIPHAFAVVGANLVEIVEGAEDAEYEMY
jgi:hypothetical protein